MQSKAALNQAKVNLGYTVITSPIDGIVISRNVDPGQTVAASMNAPTLFVIAADLTKMQVVANIDESDVGRMRPGQTVRFRVDAYPTETFNGNVAQVRLQPTVVQNVVVYSTVIAVPNQQLKLKPGMTANVNIEIARRNDALRVPTAAVAVPSDGGDVPGAQSGSAAGNSARRRRSWISVAGAALATASRRATGWTAWRAAWWRYAGDSARCWRTRGETRSAAAATPAPAQQAQAAPPAGGGRPPSAEARGGGDQPNAAPSGRPWCWRRQTAVAAASTPT